MDYNDIKHAAELLRHDGLVAFPTETVYGLGGNALSDSAVAAIYETKGRPSFNPLIIHVASIVEAERYVVLTLEARQLAQRFWPGPLTLVAQRTPNCSLSLLACAGLDTAAIRVPAHPLAQALLRESGLPIAAPSANRSGRISPTLAAHVQEELGNRGIPILDGGACSIGIESTIVDVSGPTPVILRPGFITHDALGIAEYVRASSAIKSPGMLERHYAPVHPLRLNARNMHEGEALLAFGSNILFGAAKMRNLSSAGDLKEAAANLFHMLRALDSMDISAIAVMPIPEEGLGIAINDRLRRAAVSA